MVDAGKCKVAAETGRSFRAKGLAVLRALGFLISVALLFGLLGVLLRAVGVTLHVDGREEGGKSGAPRLGGTLQLQWEAQ